MVEHGHLEIWMAPAGAGKTTAALDLYRGVLAGEGRPLGPRRRGLWLAPTRIAAAEVREALVGSGQGFLDPGVTTFSGFAAAVVWDAGRRVREISTLQRRRLVRQVIDEAAAEGALAYFGRVAGTAGLVNLVDERIAALNRRDVSVEAFQRGGRGASPRRREMAELYRRYEERLAAGGWVDAEGLFLEAREGARSVAEIGTGLELVVVDGFTDFTSAQLGILRVLAERARRVVVTLTGEAERAELFAKTEATRRKLMELGGVASDAALFQVSEKPGYVGEFLRNSRVGTSPDKEQPGAMDAGLVQVSEKPGYVSEKPGYALRYLERNLFRGFGAVEPLSPEVMQSLDSIEIVAASSVQAEIEEIARRVKRLLVDGVPPGDVVVAFRSTAAVADRVRGAFDDFGIPVHLDTPRRLVSTALMRSLLGVLRLHAEDWPYRRLLAVVGDRSLSAFELEPVAGQWPAPGTESKAVDGRTAVELCVRHAQLPAGRRALLEQVAAWAEDESGLVAVEKEVAVGAERVLARFGEVLEGLPERAGVVEWIEAVERICLSLELLGGGDYDAAYPLPSPPLKGEGAGRIDSGAWLALVSGLKAVARVDESTGSRGVKLTASEFVDLVTTVAGEIAAPDRRDATGRVRVLSAEGARLARPRHLLVGGLSEQSFAMSRRGDAISADDEEGGSEDASGDGGEMLLFYQLVTRATETLTLSYPALDAKAQAMPASPLLIELERCFGGELKRVTQPLAFQSQREGAPLSRGELRRRAVGEALSRKREGLAAMVRSPRYAGAGQSLLDGIEAIASRGDRRAFGAFEGLFSSDAVQAILERKYGPEHLWSPSKLETYAACPFRFFAENVLSLTPAPELVLESDLARRGSVLHDTLARLYARLNAAAEEGGEAPTPETVARRFQETLDAIVGSRPRRGLDAVLREVERRQIAAWAERFSRQHVAYDAAWRHLDAPLVPKYFEARFGPKHRRSESLDDASLSTEKPFELDVSGERMRFTGQIDRIDVGRVGERLVFNVIDYKTSASARVKPDDVRSGLQIQLPLYAMAAAELLLADRQAAALSAGYWSIRGKGFGAGARSGGPLAIGEIRDGRVEVAAGWTELRQELLARIAEIVGGIRRGAFPVFNADINCGQFCPYSTGCRIGHVRSLEKVWPIPDAPTSSGSLPLEGRAGEVGDAGTHFPPPP